MHCMSHSALYESQCTVEELAGDLVLGLKFVKLVKIISIYIFDCILTLEYDWYNCNTLFYQPKLMRLY